MKRTIEEELRKSLEITEDALRKANQEIASLAKDVDRWHRIAMDAGVIVHTDGSTSHPMRQELADARADLVDASKEIGRLRGVIAAQDRLLAHRAERIGELEAVRKQ